MKIYAKDYMAKVSSDELPLPDRVQVLLETLDQVHVFKSMNEFTVWLFEMGAVVDEFWVEGW
jgi:hypothetical protein